MNISHQAELDSWILDPHFLHPLSPLGIRQPKRFLSKNPAANDAYKPRCRRPKPVKKERMQSERRGQDQREEEDKAYYRQTKPE
jgi:hypothetical protein